MEHIAAKLVAHGRRVRLLLILATLVAVFGMSRLRVDDVPRAFFRSDDRSFATLEEVYRDFGSDDGECIVLLESDELFTPDVLGAIAELDRDLARIAGVAEVLGLPDVLVFDSGLPRPLLPDAEAGEAAFERARERALAHPLVAGNLLSEDGGAALLVVRLDDEVQAISSIRPVVDEIEERLRRARGPKLSARLTGIPPIRAVIFESIEREQAIFSAIGALLGFAVGWIVFRRLGPILITSCTSILAGVWALGAFGILGQPINILNSGLPLLIMVIALTDAVHLMIDILRSRHAGLGVEEAAKGALRHLGIPCALTSLTTAIGFGSLAVSRVAVIRNFGLLFAIAVGLSFVVIVTAVPTLAARFLRAGPRSGFDSRPNRLHAAAERLIGSIVRHAAGVACTGVLVTLGLFGLALRLEPDNRLTEATPSGAESVQVLADCERLFGGVLTTSVLCTWPAEREIDDELFDAIGAVQAAFDADSFFHASTSVLDLIALLPTSSESRAERARGLALVPQDLVERTFRPDLGRALVSARAPDRPTEIAEAACERLESTLTVVGERYPWLSLELTGSDVVARRNVNVMIVDFALGLGVAAAVILAVLGIAFGSWRLAVLCLLPNLFPLVLSAALLTLFDLELQMTSVIAFTVCLGLAVDDTIHFIARFQRELASNGDPGVAARNAFLHVGRALLVTTSILLAGFAALSFSAIPTTRTFAGICALGLLAALVGDLVFLPALLVAFTRRRSSGTGAPRGQRKKGGSSVSSSF